MRFALLGTLVLIDDAGDPVSVSGGRQRALLASLLLSANVPVSADSLSEAVWDGSPPPGVAATLRSHVRRLRQALGPGTAARITACGPGYRISVQEPELDVLGFEAACADAGAARRAGRWQDASSAATRALQLWRGAPLLDVSSQVLRDQFVPRLEQLRLQALEDRTEADLRLGRQDRLIPELRDLAAQHPMRERFHAQLMEALAGAGRRAEALDAYREARRALAEELGIEPGPHLQVLHQQILDGDPVLAAPPAGQDGTPRAPAPLSGSGSSLAGLPRQLPAAVPHFTGRLAELARLARILDQVGGPAPGTVVISAIGGTAGVGKTALALRFAHLAADRFPDGQLYLDLRGFDPSLEPVHPAAAVRAFLDGLHVPAGQIPPGLDAQAGLYRSMLAGRRMLIVLDNAASASQVRPLLPATGHCLVVVTSRRQLTALAAAEGACVLMLDVLTDSEARELLAARLGAARLAQDPAATAELISACARLPLALAVVAARAQARPRFPLAAVAGELRDARGRLDALDGGEATVDVRAAFSWSYQQLPPAAARMFRLLGLHPGPDITVAAAASLGAVSRAAAGQALGQLAAACLLTEHVPGRFAFHDLLRAYAAEQAAAAEDDGQRQAAIHRSADHYLQSARAADKVLYVTRAPVSIPRPQPGTQPEDFSDYAQALAWLDREHHVLLAVISLAAATGLHACAWQLPWTLETFFSRQAHWRDWAASQTIALASARRAGDRDGQVHAHRGIANAYIATGSHDKARQHLAQALQLCQSAGDLAGQARVQLDLGRSANLQQRYGDLLAHARRALELSRMAHDVAGESHGLEELAWALALAGDYEQSIEHCHAALRLFRDTGDHPGQTAVWDTLGLAHHHLGHHQQAAACYQRALQFMGDYGFRYDKAITLIGAGRAFRAAGDTQAAADAWREALAILQDTHHPDTAKVIADLRDLSRSGHPDSTGVTLGQGDASN